MVGVVEIDGMTLSAARWLCDHRSMENLWRQIRGRLGLRTRLGHARRRLGGAIRGGDPILEDMSLEARRQMWPAAPDLADRHVQNCRVLRNRVAMLEFMPKRAVCAEVGIWTGEFSAQIMQATQPATLHLIDIDKEWIDRAAQRFRQKIDHGEVRLHLGDSSTILSTMPKAYFDWLYIDGDHSYEGAKADLEAALPTLKDGGLIALNDYTFFAPSDFAKYGVMEAVHGFCIAHEFEFVFFALQGRGYHDVALRRI
jgi:predicted O-methyltransferase YrrM